MNQRFVLIGTFLSLASLATAAPLVNRPAVYGVPNIPHGQDWSIFVVPVFDISVVLPRSLMSEDELVGILPAALRLTHLESAGRNLPTGTGTPRAMDALIGIVAGTGLMLAAYSLIPRAHSGVLRLRSLHFKQDLFS